MKIYYQGKEVGLSHNVKKVYDIFGDNIRISPKNVIACKCNNEIKSLDYELNEGDKVELIDVTDKDGMKVYIRGTLFIMSMAIEKLYPKAKLVINYQLSNSMFCEIQNQEINDEFIENVKSEMQKIVENDYPIEKKIMNKEEAEKFFTKQKDDRGILQIENKDKDEVSLYFCNDYYNYFYGVMPLSTSYINIFDINKYKTGFIIRYPSRKDPTRLGEFKDNKKFTATLQFLQQKHYRKRK